GSGKPLLGRDAGIDDDQPLALTGRERVKKRLHGILTTGSEARPTYEPHADPTNHDDAGGRRDDVRPHCPPRTVTEALPGQSSADSRTQPGDGRRVESNQ